VSREIEFLIERLIDGEWVDMTVLDMPKSGKAHRRMRVVVYTNPLFLMDYEDIARVTDERRPLSSFSQYRAGDMCRSARKCATVIGAISVAKVGDYNNDTFAFIFEDDDRLVEARLRYC
jgi:hypothetical protein